MKNFSAIYELIYLIILMAAGAVGVSTLLDSNLAYTYERFADKTLTPVTFNLAIFPNPNVLTNKAVPEQRSPKELYSIEVSETYYSADDIIAMFYVQDDTCPINEYGHTTLKFDGELYPITDRWAASKYTHLIDVQNKIFEKSYNSMDVGFYLTWDEVNHAWHFIGRSYIFDTYDQYGIPTYIIDGRVEKGEI